MPGAKRRVLLADDDPGLRRLIGTTLGTDDFDLLQAVDGEEALRIAQQQHPELVLLDVNMPKMDGFEVCRHIKTDPLTSSIKVVMLTARGAETPAPMPTSSSPSAPSNCSTRCMPSSSRTASSASPSGRGRAER